MAQITANLVEQIQVVNDKKTLDQTTTEFDENDLDNRKNWRRWQKWSIVGALALMNFMSIYASAAIVPAAPQVLDSLNTDSKIYRTLLVTIWGLGEGIVALFLLAPLAERYGRLPIFHIGNLLSVCCAVGGALSVNISMLIAFQFLSGVSLPVVVLGPAVVGDLYADEERGFVMSVTFTAIVLADFVSPIIGSYTNEGLGWRWILWLNAIAFGVVGVICLFLMRETYPGKILERKAARLGTGGNRNDSSNQEAEDTTRSVIRQFIMPVKVLLQSPTVLIVSLCAAIIYGLLSLIFATLTEVMESTYSISPGSVGLVFLSLAIGNLIATAIYSLTSDRYIKQQKKQKGEGFRPEARLVHLLLATLLFPCGFLIYGWTAEYRVQYIVPLVGVAINGAGLTFALLATDTYLVDIFNAHGASAIAGCTVLRTIFGTVLPLAGPALYDKAGLGWGNSALALISAVLVPIMFILMRYGQWFRSKGRIPDAEKA